MGNNVISCCHKCKVQMFHYRNEENKTILPFYRKHRDCAKEDINNAQTVMNNNGTDQPWQYMGQSSLSKEGYPDEEMLE
ncbi:hypothetical protein LCGC14_1597960 [marine sediment metagenome]|uniref:Uncharacterized protein n=1 Tax=marine sediment metagenome TaxID=412755 RepID=A0A0F9LCB2_9ZZZZ